MTLNIMLPATEAVHGQAAYQQAESSLNWAESWYPVCLARELKPGRVLSVHAFGTRLAVFRTHSGRPGVLFAHCSHMGADLSRGRVLGERLQCPLHRWSYGVDGQCETGASSVPANITQRQQQALPCEEHYGLIFVFWGRVARFRFPAILGEERQNIASRPVVWEFDTAYDVPAINTFDRHHFASVHQRELEAYHVFSSNPYHLACAFQARVAGLDWADRLMRAVGYARVAVRMDCWSANLVFMRHAQTGHYGLFASLPIAQHKSRLFSLVVAQRATGSWQRRLWARLLARLRLSLAKRMILHFVAQDARVLDGLRFPDNEIAAYDAALQRWLEHYRLLPKWSLAAILSPAAGSARSEDRVQPAVDVWMQTVQPSQRGRA